MSQESGSVPPSREARVRVRFVRGAEVECLLDTGFDGALMLPRTLVAQLQLPIVGRLIFQTVSGTRMSADLALAEVDWLAQPRSFEVIVSEGEDALIGTEMLAGTRLTIDYVAQTVTIASLDN